MNINDQELYRKIIPEEKEKRIYGFSYYIALLFKALSIILFLFLQETEGAIYALGLAIFYMLWHIVDKVEEK